MYYVYTIWHHYLAEVCKWIWRRIYEARFCSKVASFRAHFSDLLLSHSYPVFNFVSEYRATMDDEKHSAAMEMISHPSLEKDTDVEQYENHESSSEKIQSVKRKPVPVPLTPMERQVALQEALKVDPGVKRFSWAAIQVSFT